MNTDRMRRFIVSGCMGLALACVSLASPAIDLTGAGASLPYPVYAKWAARYHALTGHRVNFQSIGSGGGQQQIIAGTVDWGASDDPMPEAGLRRHDLFQFPAIIGGIVPVVNIPGIAPGALRLSGALLADIYLGRIRRWDDRAIVALNPELALPATDIVVVHRADGSGTTYGWTSYLARVSPQWRDQVGMGKAIRWPLGQGGKGNEGVAAYVSQLRYSVGYVEYAYAAHNGLSWVRLRNRAGAFVAPQASSFQAAALDADWQSAPGMGVMLTDAGGEEAWPITAASFILVPRTVRRRPERMREVLAYFDWAFREGGDIARELGYVALPDTVIGQIRERWAHDIRTPRGEAIWE